MFTHAQDTHAQDRHAQDTCSRMPKIYNKTIKAWFLGVTFDKSL